MHVGIVLFGNGAIEEDGTISKAIVISELTGDLPAVEKAVAGMERQAGFTNMAQAYALGDKLLQQNGRKAAQSAILTVTDGKPSFLFETREKNKALKAKGITFFNVGISKFEGGDAWKLMKELASQPADTNTVRVPGLDALQDGAGPFVEQALTKFCPMSLSPSALLAEQTRAGFMLVRKAGYCGRLGACLGNATNPVNDEFACHALAMEQRATAFTLGTGFQKGSCCVDTGFQKGSSHDVSCDSYAKFQADLEKPECATISAEFQENEFFNWYAVAPFCETPNPPLLKGGS